MGIMESYMNAALTQALGKLKVVCCMSLFYLSKQLSSNLDRPIIIFHSCTYTSSRSKRNTHFDDCSTSVCFDTSVYCIIRILQENADYFIEMGERNFECLPSSSTATI